MLQPLVDSGKLPPVDNGCQPTLMVVGGRDAIGVYGENSGWSTSTRLVYRGL